MLGSEPSLGSGAENSALNRPNIAPITTKFTVATIRLDWIHNISQNIAAGKKWISASGESHSDFYVLSLLVLFKSEIWCCRPRLDDVIRPSVR